METFSALLALCAGNSSVTSEFLSQRPVTRSFDVFIDLRLDKRLSIQSCGWWFDKPSRSLWRHRNVNTYFLSWLYSILPSDNPAVQHSSSEIVFNAVTFSFNISTNIYMYIYIYICVCQCLWHTIISVSYIRTRSYSRDEKTDKRWPHYRNWTTFRYIMRRLMSRSRKKSKTLWDNLCRCPVALKRNSTGPSTALLPMHLSNCGASRPFNVQGFYSLTGQTSAWSREVWKPQNSG